MKKKSILQPDEKKCYLTGSTINLDKHHIFNGPNRNWSDKEGLWVWLNHDVHMAVHQNRPDLAMKLKRAGQMAYEKEHTREEFVEHVRKNYL